MTITEALRVSQTGWVARVLGKITVFYHASNRAWSMRDSDIIGPKHVSINNLATDWQAVDPGYILMGKLDELVPHVQGELPLYDATHLTIALDRADQRLQAMAHWFSKLEGSSYNDPVFAVSLGEIIEYATALRAML
jgi:hypothetical protein